MFTNDGHGEVNIDGEVDDLRVDERDRDVTIGGHLAQTVPEVRQPAHHVAVAGGVGDQAVLVSFVQDLHTPLGLDG